MSYTLPPIFRALRPSISPLRRTLLAVFLTLVLLPVAAQTQTQRGVARMITRSMSDPIVPVSNVRVVVGNAASKGSDAQGRFTVNVLKNNAGSYQIADIRLPQGSKLILASPSKKKTLFLSSEDLAVTFTTPEDQKAVSLATYRKLKAEYDRKAQDLIALRTQLESQRAALQNNDAASAQLKLRIDSIQSIINEYFDDKKRDYTLKELQRIADELSLTDYQSLDSLERRIYDLKQAGEWQTISSLLHDLMRGNAAAWIQSYVVRADRANRDFLFAMDRLKDAIESFEMQHLNDSAARYYEILTQADTTNWKNFSDAGEFEYEHMGRFTQAHKYFEAALHLANTDSLIAITYNNLGCVYADQGDFEHAKVYTQRALDIQLKALGEWHPDVATSYNNLGAILLDIEGKYTYAEKYIKKALKIRLKAFGEQSSEVASCYNSLANTYYGIGDYDNAKEYYQKALNIQLTELGELNPDVAITYSNIANLYETQDDYNLAEKYHQKALEIGITVLGKQHPNLAYFYGNSGNLYRYNRDYIQAEEYYQKALDIRLAVFGDQHPAVANSYCDFGNLYYTQNDYTRAEECYQKALKIRLAVRGEKSRAVASSYNDLGDVYKSIGNSTHSEEYYQKAEEYYQKALKLCISILGKQHPTVATIYNNLASLYEDQCYHYRAMEIHQKALKIQLAAWGEQSPALVYTYKALADYAIYQYDFLTAEEYLQKAANIQTFHFGKDDPRTCATFLRLDYVRYKNSVYNPDSSNVFMLTHAITAQISDTVQLATHGISGTYYVLSFGDWTIDTDTIDVFTYDYYNDYYGERTTRKIVLYRDGKIWKEHLDKYGEATFHVEQISKKEKIKLKAAWAKWKIEQDIEEAAKEAKKKKEELKQEQDTNDALIKLWEQRRKDKTEER